MSKNYHLNAATEMLFSKKKHQEIETENKCELLDIDYKPYKREKPRGARVIKERIFNQVLRNE